MGTTVGVGICEAREGGGEYSKSRCECVRARAMTLLTV